MINVLPLVLVLGCVAFGLALYGHMRSAVVVALVGLGILLLHVAGYIG
jgi:hypothetical protein